MKNSIKFLGAIALIALVGCKKIDASKGTKSDHTVEVGVFTEIDFGISGDLTYEQSDLTSIVVTANEKVFKALDIKVKGDKLTIEAKKGYNFKNSDEIKIKISSPLINELELSGSGLVDATFKTSELIPNLNLSISGSGLMKTNEIWATNLSNSISGSGNLTVKNIVADKVASKISGSGFLTISGNSVDSDVSLSGSGNFKGYNLITENTNVKISGSGTAEVNANTSLDVDISGSGSVFYKGTAQPSLTGSGSGTLINGN